MAYLMFLSGTVVWILLKLQKAKSLKGFTMGTFLFKNTIPFVINMIVGNTMIYAGVTFPFSEIFGVDLVKIDWFLFGIGCQVLFRKIYKQFEAKFV